jgi:hypothetical protein
MIPQCLDGPHSASQMRKELPNIAGKAFTVVEATSSRVDPHRHGQCPRLPRFSARQIALDLIGKTDRKSQDHESWIDVSTSGED